MNRQRIHKETGLKADSMDSITTIVSCVHHCFEGGQKQHHDGRPDPSVCLCGPVHRDSVVLSSKMSLVRQEKEFNKLRTEPKTLLPKN